MKFQKFVSRTTKGLFLFLVLIMVVSLVMMGTLGGPSDRGMDVDAGVIFDSVHVTVRDFDLHLRKAAPAYWWNGWLREATDPMMARVRRRRPQPPPPPKEEQLAKLAWENIVLLEDARRKGITATEREVDQRLSDIFDAITRGQLEKSTDGFQQIANTYFHATLPVFQAWVADQVVLDKLMGLVEEGEFADYEKVYGEMAKLHRQARVWVASFDPKDFSRELKPVRPEEIAKYYEGNKDRYKVGDKIQVSYLMADYEEFKKKVADPPEDEVRKFYEEHKDEFRRPREEHQHKEGEKHSEDEPAQIKPLDEVRSQVQERIKTEKARLEAKKVMERVDKNIGAAFKDDKFPEDLFDRIKDDCKREGFVLLHDVTGAFDARGVADVEKVIGENSDLKNWGFEGARKTGDISKRNDTTKGSLFYRIQKKNASYDPGLTEPVRKAIEKELEKQQLRKRSDLIARNVVQEILKKGFAPARRKYASVEWRPSRYFGPRNMAEAGIEEPMLANMIARQIWDGTLTMERRATTVPGAASYSPEKREWTYAVYLEDVIEKFPEDAQEEFRAERDRVDRDARDAYRRDYVTKTVALANLKDLREKKEEEKKGSKPAPNPKG